MPEMWTGDRLEWGIIMKFIKSINELTKAILNLSKNLQGLGLCKHEFEEVRYFYDDDWGYKGSKVWDGKWKEKRLCACKKCGAVFIQNAEEE